ncbi:recombinase family protein [Croceibacterium sp. LX-88]|jgi:putative DNA-invertase from lambdoid prophage Rac|uniref:Recombinase family protein n=1 Tax=Croceibacterium selenioxidans TaxID=2838833 RepID=A0ABS5W0I4_9SPHN|nr:recombinase family protein [Croceibacterium selenioxidans]MBT2133285.1 recombinase family protein [Croceibacterium selenioxidans]
MFHHIAYYRVSASDPSIEVQRTMMGGSFDQEFSDEGVSSSVKAADRPGFADLLASIRKGDTLYVFAVDRLGRDALDVQTNVRRLIDAGVAVEVRGLGRIGGDVGELLLTLLAQLAELERRKIAERTAAGRQVAREALKATGKTHRGKSSLGRPFAANAEEVREWRKANKASIAKTAEQFGLSPATVKRYCAAR